ncbi:MAG: hypothetical protein KBT75_09800 [Oleispira antarctica]|nr:hypothetical protein [Oleispira antarctica]
MKKISSLFLSLTLCISFGLLSTETAARQITDAELSARSMDQGRTIQSRIRSLKKLYSHMLIDGEIPPRTLCVWDVLGTNGPIYTALLDQQLRFKHYGIELDIEAYINEQDVVDKLKSGHCHTSIMTGAKAREFNDFTGSIEALGGVPSRKHMSYLLQVLASTNAHKKMIQGDYHIIGIIPIGLNYLFTRDGKQPSLARTLNSKRKASVVEGDESQSALFNAFNLSVIPGLNTAAAAGAYNLADADLLIAPLVGYNMFSLAAGLKNGSIVDYPLSQMTLQVVARLDMIPMEVGQFIREDLFVKMNMYYRKVESNTRGVPTEKMYKLSERDENTLGEKIEDIRAQLTREKKYNSSMMKLQKNIRCKIDNTLKECKK